LKHKNLGKTDRFTSSHKERARRKNSYKVLNGKSDTIAMGRE